MMARALAALGLLATGLGVALALQITSPSDTEYLLRYQTEAQPVTRAPGVWTTTQEAVDVVLARPLFAASRRPVAQPQRGTVVAGLPRLTGVLVSPTGSAAIFAGESGKPVVLKEGSRIGAFTVRTIAAGQVTVDGTAGTLVLRPLLAAQAEPPAEPAPRRAATPPLPTLSFDPTRPFDPGRVVAVIERGAGGVSSAPR